MTAQKTCSYNTLSDVVHTFSQREDDDALCFFNGFRILRYSYRDIRGLSLRCAALFQEKGIHKRDRILIWAANRPEWGVVFCACALTGVVLVPLDARNTPEFAEHVGLETEAKLLVRSMTRRDPGLPIPTLYIDDLFNTLTHYPPLESLPQVQPEDTLEIVYTSGTTGNPKGVVLSHQNIASNLSAILDFIPIDRTWRLLSVLPLSHALEQTAGFWTPLAGGGSVLYLQALKPSALFEAFQRERITAMVLVPRLLDILKQRIENTLEEKHLSAYLRLGLRLAPFLPRALRKLYFYPVHKKFNPKFHLFVSGGSSLPFAVEKFWKAIGFELLQGYGLTETSPVLTATRPGRTRMSSVGEPVKQTEIQLSGEQEILARGPNVFSGYYKNEEATRQVFEGGWFKTGDTGELDSDGYLYIRGRIKDIIVTSDAINVYPEDIECHLDACPEVKESCVIGAGDHQETVHAVLLLHPNHTDAESIIATANTQLAPEQRIESWSLWPHDEFPKTTTLKIKKAEVRKTISSASGNSPAGPVIEGTHLQQILCEMAGIPLPALRGDAQLGAGLGVSSIGRLELISRLEEEFRLDIDDESVMPATTVDELEQLIAQRKNITSSLCFRRWTLSFPCRIIRSIFHAVVIRPALKYFCDLTCHGIENLRGLKGPVLIVSNHTSHIDTPLIMHLLPPHIGKRICPAAWKEYFDSEGQTFSIRAGKWMAWQIATIFFNIFPFPQTAGFRRSMAYAGELADRGWSILYYPEGGRTKDGSWGDFQEGIGMLANNLHIPILPVAIKGGEIVLPARAGWPKQGKIQIAFGEPITIQSIHYQEVTKKIKEEITVLWNGL